MPAAKKKRKTNGAVRKRAASSRDLTRQLAEAAWAEADAALADALTEFGAWQAGDADAAEFVGQALRRAARKRGLSPLGEAGSVEAYDSSRHALGKLGSRPPARVKIKSPGVLRGGEVLAKARVTSVRRKP
ncbi:MAG: hypothetical protein QM759_15965 [Terricaulis sp.]